MHAEVHASRVHRAPFRSRRRRRRAGSARDFTALSSQRVFTRSRERRRPQAFFESIREPFERDGWTKVLHPPSRPRHRARPSTDRRMDGWTHAERRRLKLTAQDGVRWCRQHR